jgi:hypothetical protein
MNTRFLHVACLLGALGVFSLALDAQSAISKATVPFEFAAGGAMLPPGEYSVDVADPSGVIVLRSTTGNSVALLATVAGTPVSTSSKMIFERRDGVVYLAAVEWPNQSARVMSAFKRVPKGAVATALH